MVTDSQSRSGRVKPGTGNPAEKERAETGWQPQRRYLYPEQARLWLLEQIFPGAPIHNLLLRVSLTGSLNIERLKKALDALAGSIPTLKLIIENEAGYLKVTENAVPLYSFSRIDSLEANEEQGEAELARLLQGEIATPLNLNSGPLLRTHLVRLSVERHQLLICAHSLAVGWASLPRLFRELVAFYEGRTNGRMELDLTDSRESFLPYWKQKLQDAPGLNLPADRTRPATMTFRGGRHPFAIEAEICQKLRSLANSEDVTVPVALLTAFKAMLHRYTGQEDIIVASGTVSRVAEAELWHDQAVALRTRISSNQPFREVLRNVISTVADASANGNVPYQGMVDLLNLDPDAASGPLCQAGFDFDATLMKAALGPGIAMAAQEVPNGMAKFDLAMALDESAPGIQGHIEYNADLYDAATARRFAEHFKVLLRAIIEEPNRCIGQLPLLTPRERQQVTVEWNATAAAYPRESRIHELFEAQVARTSERVALVFEEQAFTYAQLNSRANSLARELRSMGVGADSLVGVCVPRSPQMLISQLAVLKAGGAYVPLDPAYPRDRLAFMASDARLTAVITHTELAAPCDLPETKTLCVDGRNWDDLEPIGNLNSAGTSENLAYVIYTSGSTGKPKGVMITHRNAANFFAGMDQVIGAEPGVWLAVTSICFDISVLELFWTLSRGFKVVLQADQKTGLGQSGEAGPYSIPAQVSRHKVTHFQCTPSLAGMIVESPGGLDALRQVKKILLGGEALPVALAGKLQGTTLINVYGPTETTVWSAASIVQPGEPITLGRPIANTQIYILDAQLQPVPVGVPGEIYIGGDGVARGYLNRPELTAERFIHDPFATGEPARMYKTGDIGRFLPDGRIDYLGRADFQVKLRGFRIELGEIENALRQHGAVRDAVVAVREYSAADKRLLAYCVPKNGKLPSTVDLRRFLKERMPEYMVPSAFVAIDKLPLTPNGKVDRKALPDVKPPGSEPTKPQTIHERSVGAIWQEILGVKDFRPSESFFALGGTAMAALRIKALIEDRLNIAIPLKELLVNPTLRAQAQLVARAPRGQTSFAGAIELPVTEAPLAELPLLTEAERQQIVEDWNATELPYPVELCLHQRFEMHARRAPGDMAIRCRDRAITYGDLNARANQLARYLVKCGTEPDMPVGIWMDRTENLVVALLAVLKSGAPYLPLDASYPPDRLRFMLEDTRARLLVTEKHWLPHLPRNDAIAICVDEEWDAKIAGENNANLGGDGMPAYNSRHLAYVIYTSGSTGRPKGVAIEHASATAFVHWARQVFTDEELGGMLASTSICFDLSVFELFAPLSWGGTVILADNIMDLPHLPARDFVRVIDTVPSAAGDLLYGGAIPESVTTFALAGEPLSTRLVEQLYALPHVRKVYDLYGPSETTTYSTYTLRNAGRATIGKPLANTQIYIVDSQLQPVRIGVPGELCIGGAGLARGYLNAAEATAEKFVPNPFRPGTRLYRTGDLARWLPNGEIEFLGRKDYQVKIRGYRIELGEIEAVMAAHPAIRECAATVHDIGDKVLAGYAVVTPNGGLNVAEFRRYLREKLPEYMVPASLTLLDAMPRTPSGKIDRKALPAPADAQTADFMPEPETQPKLNPIEDSLADIWREVIGVQTVKADDNFFDLGGHSVLVVQVLARVRTAFQVNVTPRNVFEAPTLAEFAALIEEKLVEEIEQLDEDEGSLALAVDSTP